MSHSPAVLTSAHCPLCHASARVVSELPSHGVIRAWELECGHAYLLDSQMYRAAVSLDQWQAALYWATPGSAALLLHDVNGNRTPSFQRLCAQFSATRTRRYGAERWITL